MKSDLETIGRLFDPRPLAEFLGGLVKSSVADFIKFFGRVREKGRNWATEAAKEEAQRTGKTPCEVLAEMLKQAKCEGNTKIVKDIEQAQKFLGCRRTGRS